MRVPVRADRSNHQESEDHTDWPCGVPRAFGRSRSARCCLLPRAHDADCPHLAVMACLCLKGYELSDAGALTVSRERGDVNEDVLATISRRNEAKATVVVPFCQSAMGAHQKGLTPEISGERVGVRWIEVLVRGTTQLRPRLPSADKMHHTNRKANCRTPAPEGNPVPPRCNHRKPETSDSAQKVDSSDDAKSQTYKREPGDNASTRQCVQRPCRKHQHHEGSDERRTPATSGSKLSHALARAEEAVPRSAKDDATDMQQGGKAAQRCTDDK